eukprot:Gb_24531 [translate_table: standard]
MAKEEALVLPKTRGGSRGRGSKAKQERASKDMS